MHYTNKNGLHFEENKCELFFKYKPVWFLLVKHEPNIYCSTVFTLCGYKGEMVPWQEA